MLLTAQSPQQFIALMRSNYRRRGRAIALKTWAQRLGYKSPRSLGMLLEGKRLPSAAMQELLAKDFGLSDLERRYFELLVLSRTTKKNDLLRETERELNKIRLNANRPIRRLTHAELPATLSWYVFVIRQLVGTKGFVENAAWISKRLREKVSASEITTAIDHLIRLGGLIRKSDSGALEKTPSGLFAGTDVPNELIRKHHIQVLERTKEAVTEQGVYERELISHIFSMRKSDLPRFKRCLNEFRDQMDERFQIDEGDSVFQLNLHLFEHTLDV
jgi:uncharacterized protein (TIGR02147 family)